MNESSRFGKVSSTSPFHSGRPTKPLLSSEPAAVAAVTARAPHCVGGRALVDGGDRFGRRLGQLHVHKRPQRQAEQHWQHPDRNPMSRLGCERPMTDRAELQVRLRAVPPRARRQSSRPASGRRPQLLRLSGAAALAAPPPLPSSSSTPSAMRRCRERSSRYSGTSVTGSSAGLPPGVLARPARPSSQGTIRARAHRGASLPCSHPDGAD